MTRAMILLLAMIGLVGCAQPPAPVARREERFYGFELYEPYIASRNQQPPVIVKPGDTLYRVAERHGVNWQDVADINGIKNPKDLYVGQRLRIPSPEYSKPAPKEETALAYTAPAPVHSRDLDAPTTAFSAAPIPQPEQYTTPAPAIATLPTSPQERWVPPQSPVKATTERWVTPTAKPAPPRPAANKIIAAAPAPQPSAPVQQARPIPTPPSPPPLYRDPGAIFAGDAPFIWPARGELTGTFGAQENGVYHDGIHIAVAQGTAVHAAQSGVVVYAGDELKGYGHLVILRHEEGWLTAYAHNSQLLVSEGDAVMQGDVIAKSGASGGAARPQLYFALRRDKKPVDPLLYLPG